MDIAMRKYAVIFLFLLVSTITFGQSKQDQTQILQKCIDLPELRSYYPIDQNGNLKPVYIKFGHPVLIPTDLIVSLGGKDLKFLVMSENRKVDAYLNFKIFKINSESASVTFDLFYDGPAPQQIAQVNIEFYKTGNNWEIKDSNLIKI